VIAGLAASAAESGGSDGTGSTVSTFEDQLAIIRTESAGDEKLAAQICRV
jgi:hypothetical protein